MHPDVHTFFTTIQDGPMKIKKNLRRFLKEQGLSDREDISMKEVHSTKIVIVDDGYVNRSEVDGLITTRRDVALVAKAADCPPILFFDPVKKVIAVAHCGWRGTFGGIVQNMIHHLMNYFGSSPEDIIVLIGPGIGICCFQLGPKDIDFARTNFGENFVRGNYVDLQMINRKQLMDLGVKSHNIKVKRVCTCCNKNYYSYQGMNMVVGSIDHFAGIIALR